MPRLMITCCARCGEDIPDNMKSQGRWINRGDRLLHTCIDGILGDTTTIDVACKERPKLALDTSKLKRCPVCEEGHFVAAVGSDGADMSCTLCLAKHMSGTVVVQHAELITLKTSPSDAFAAFSYRIGMIFGSIHQYGHHMQKLAYWIVGDHGEVLDAHGDTEWLAAMRNAAKALPLNTESGQAWRGKLFAHLDRCIREGKPMPLPSVSDIQEELEGMSPESLARFKKMKTGLITFTKSAKLLKKKG